MEAVIPYYVAAIRSVRPNNPLYRWMREPRRFRPILARCADLFLGSRASAPGRTIFLAAAPKSGSEWLSALLGKLPGYRHLRPYDPDCCTLEHDICQAIFERLPGRRVSVVKLHTRPRDENLAVLTKLKIKTIILSRDPRDLAISRMMHVRQDKYHRHHHLYVQRPDAEAVMHSLRVEVEEYLPWVLGWKGICENRPDEFRWFTYEQLKLDAAAVMREILRFYELPIDDSLIAGAVGEVARETVFDITKNYRNNRNLARRGIVGDWRNYFTPEHVAQCKRTMGPALVGLGYERDLDWSS